MFLKKIKNAAIWAAFLISSGLSAQDISSILPENINNWKRTDTVRLISGNELYNYIDGGAEIFMEYGFQQAASVNYTDASEKSLSVEIYKMNDDPASYGIYSFYLNTTCQKIDAGQEGAFIDYYGVAWKGDIITIVSTPAGDTTLKPDIINFLKVISDKYSKVAQKPAWIEKLNTLEQVKQPVKYLEGKVGLSNVYKFVPGNAFAFNQAVSFFIGNEQLVVFKYETENENTQVLNEALEKMKKSNKEAVFTNLSNGFYYTDYKNNLIYSIASKNLIITAVGKDLNSIKKSIEVVKNGLQ